MAITFENAAAATTFLNKTVQVDEAAVKYSDIEVKVGNFAEKFFNFFRNLVEIIRNSGLRNIQVTVQGAGDESAVTTRIKVTVAVRDELTNANIRYANNVIDSARRAGGAGTSTGTVLVPATPSASSHSSSSEAKQGGPDVVVTGTPEPSFSLSSEESEDSKSSPVAQSSSRHDSEEDEYNVLGEHAVLTMETAALTGGEDEAKRKANLAAFQTEVAPQLENLTTGEGGPFLPEALKQFEADQRAEGGRGGRALARGGEVSAEATRLAPVTEELASQQPLENTGTDS